MRLIPSVTRKSLVSSRFDVMRHTQKSMPISINHTETVRSFNTPPSNEPAVGPSVLMFSVIDFLFCLAWCSSTRPNQLWVGMINKIVNCGCKVTTICRDDQAIAHKTDVLLHLVHPFPSYFPCSVGWKSGIRDLGSAIPTGTHHGNSSEQRTVARHVET